MACACAFVLRRFAANFGLGGSDAHVYEMSLIILASYLAYLAAEVRAMACMRCILFRPTAWLWLDAGRAGRRQACLA